jgi:hypothetical protein
VEESVTLCGSPRWRSRSKLGRMLVVGLVALAAALLPAAGSFVPKASGIGMFGGVAQAACKWDGKPGPGALHNTFDKWWFKADVASNWCYDGVHVTSRHSVATGGVTNWGVLGGWFWLNWHWALSQCYQYNGYYNNNCLTHAEYNLVNGHTGDTKSICIETRIYGNGYHHRQITETTSDACRDGLFSWFWGV